MNAEPKRERVQSNTVYIVYRNGRVYFVKEKGAPPQLYDVQRFSFFFRLRIGLPLYPLVTKPI
jgi:hypothetical protein